MKRSINPRGYIIEKRKEVVSARHDLFCLDSIPSGLGGLWYFGVRVMLWEVCKRRLFWWIYRGGMFSENLKKYKKRSRASQNLVSSHLFFFFVWKYHFDLSFLNRDQKSFAIRSPAFIVIAILPLPTCTVGSSFMEASMLSSRIRCLSGFISITIVPLIWFRKGLYHCRIV